MQPTPQAYERGRRLRREMTLPEVLLWRELRRRAVGDLKFRRQHPIGPFIVDFYCARLKLAVEVDGWGHNMGRPDYDARRDAFLSREGVRVLRFAAEDVLREMESVLSTIAAAGDPLPGFAGTPPRGGGDHDR